MAAMPPPHVPGGGGPAGAASPTNAVAAGSGETRAAAPSSPSGPASDPALDQSQLVRLREVRAEAQDLLAALDSVRRGEATVASYAAYVRRTMQDIGALLADVTARNDEVRHLRNAWEQMEVNPLLARPEDEYTAQEQLHYLDMLAAQIRRVVYYAGYLTIPTRLNEWLAQARPGYYVPFHLVFEDELPEREDRARVLSHLAYSPRVIVGGLVDAANGLIYRYADSPGERRLSLIWVALALAACTGAVALAPQLGVSGWPLQRSQTGVMLVGWLAVLAGVVTHVGVGGVKRAQTQQGGLPPIIAVGDFSMIVSARVGQILQKVFLALVGFFGLVFGAGADKLTVFNAFLVGYSLDSFVELFRGSIEQRATAQVASLKKQLGVAG